MSALDRLRSALADSWRVLAKELSAFGVVGAVNFALDIGIFQLLYAHVGMGALPAKVISTVVTTTTAYVMHRHWSFSHRARVGIRREYPVFVLVNGLTLLLSLAIIGFVRYPLGETDPWVLQMANVLSIGIGTVIRFLCYKRWVFPRQEQAGEPAAEPTMAS